MIWLLLLSLSVHAQEASSPTASIPLEDEMKLSNVRKGLAELQSGRPNITGYPTFRAGVKFENATGNAITFQDGTTLNTAPSDAQWGQFVSSKTCAYWSRRGTAIPADDTIPLISEGWQVLVATFTPVNASSTLLIEARINATEDSNVGDYGVMTLFESGSADAIQASNLWAGGDAGSTQGPAPGFLRHIMSAANTNARYYTVNVGCNVADCFGVNDRAAARMYGGVECSELTITEILP